MGFFEEFFAVVFFCHEGVSAKLKQGISFLGSKKADACEVVKEEDGGRRLSKSIFELS